MFYDLVIKEPKDNSPYAIAKRASLFILVLNFVLFAVKGIVGILGDSFAMVADSLNSLTDVGTSLALFFALQMASKPPDDVHAYGHGKIETEIARILGLVVLGTAGAIIVGGIQKINETQSVPKDSVIVVAAMAIVVKEYMYRFQARVARQISSRSLQADAINHRTDVGATACVLLGTVIVKIGGQGLAPMDDLAAIIIGAIMAFAAGRVVLSSTMDMLDPMPPAEMIEEIRHLVRNIPGIYDTEKILGRKVGLFYNIDLHVEVDPNSQVLDAHHLGHQAVELIKEKMPGIGEVLVHVEPHLSTEERKKLFAKSRRG